MKEDLKKKNKQIEMLSRHMSQSKQTPKPAPVNDAQILLQQSLVDTKKKERSLDVKVHEQIKIIDDLKRQIQRGSEINKNLVDKVKQRD